MISVSLLVPVYNHAKFLNELFESIWAQDYKQFQIIAVDDGSTDNSYELLLEYSSRSPLEMIVLRKNNGGICSALNLALKYATGELVAILASDDLLLPNRFSGQVPLFQKYSELKVLYNNGRYLINGEQRGSVHDYSSRFLSKGIHSVYDYVTNEVPALFIQSMLIKRSFLSEIGEFDEDTNSDDWALNIKIFQSLTDSNEFKFVDVDVFLYRSHQDQFHRSHVNMNDLIRRVARKYLTPRQLAKFNLKYEILNCLRDFFNLNLAAAAVAFRRAQVLICELNMSRLDAFLEIMATIYRSAILKKYRYFSSMK